MITCGHGSLSFLYFFQPSAQGTFASALFIGDRLQTFLLFLRTIRFSCFLLRTFSSGFIWVLQRLSRGLQSLDEFLLPLALDVLLVDDLFVEVFEVLEVLALRLLARFLAPGRV